MRDPAAAAAELQRTLEHAFSSYREGRLAEAAADCRTVLETLPGEPNALHLLGIVQLVNGEREAAAETLSIATESQPDNAEIHNSLGAALRASGRLDDAEASFRRAIKLNPGATQGYFNLGNTLTDARRQADAENCYRTVLSMDSGHVEAIVALAGLAERGGDADAAIAGYRKAIALTTTNAEPHRRLGALLGAAKDWSQALRHLETAVAIDPNDAPTHAEKAIVLNRMGRLDDAADAFGHALDLEPDSIEAIANFATALCECGDAVTSLDYFERAIRADPANPDILANYANAMVAVDWIDEALAHYDAALALDPRHADARSSKANTLKAVGRLTEAIEHYDATLEIAPEHANARYGRSVALLSLGRFDDGWHDYRWRPSMRDADSSISRDPLARDLAGQAILVVKDQGLGDELFFLRFIPHLRALGARPSYHADPRIARMIGRAGLFERVVETAPSAAEFDRVVSIGDLPGLFSHEAGRATPPAPEIPPLASRVRDMTSRLGAGGPPPYIGLTWRAGTTGVRGALSKEAPLADLARVLANVEGTVVVVQREPSDDELTSLADGLGRAPLDLSAHNTDLEDMLALMGLLDAYVAVSNTNVHLRAARRRTSRILAPLAGEYRWMAEGSRSPWFEGTTVYRETQSGWSEAFEALERDLADGAG